MKKVIIGLASVAVIGGGLFFGVNNFGKPGANQDLVYVEAATKEHHGFYVDEVNVDEIKSQTEQYEELLNSIEDEYLKLDLGADTAEYEVIEIMHGMTHQKILADQKWSSTPMHKDVIDQLKPFIESSNYDNKEEFLNILSRWDEGDFSHAVEDHNYFWNLQNGTIGKAYGEMALYNEMDYIESNFK